MTTILLVDDHILFRQGVCSILAAQPDLHVVGQAGSVREAIDLTTYLHPDIILMDFGLPDGSGLDATRAILQHHPTSNIIFLTIHEDSNQVVEAIRLGAKGYLLKNIQGAELIKFLRNVQRGEFALSPRMIATVLNEFVRNLQSTQPLVPQLQALSSRERQVLDEVATNSSNQEIAHRLSISENTVKNHVRNILAKLNVRNRREAADFLGKTP